MITSELLKFEIAWSNPSIHEQDSLVRFVKPAQGSNFSKTTDILNSFNFQEIVRHTEQRIHQELGKCQTSSKLLHYMFVMSN